MLQLILIIVGILFATTLTSRQMAKYTEKLLLIFGLINGGLIYLKGYPIVAILYIILFIATITLLIFWKYLNISQTESKPIKLTTKTILLILIFLIGSVAFIYLIFSGYAQPRTDEIQPANQSLIALLLAGILLSFIVGIAHLKQWYSR